MIRQITAPALSLALVSLALVSLGSQTGTGEIVGQVIDASTNRPIPSATVVMNRPVPPGGRGAGPRASGPASAPVRLLTGADGRFVIRDLPSGSFRIDASANGYVSGTTGQTRPGSDAQPVDVADGERVTGVQIRLWKCAVLAGTVVDESGEPAVGTRVRAFRKSVLAGRVRYMGGDSASTDDRGVFRITGLMPGNYIVLVPETHTTMPVATLDAMMQMVASGTPASAALMDLAGAGGPMPLTAGRRVDDLMVSSTSGLPELAGDGRIVAYQTVFYPSVATLADATAIAVGSGEVRSGVDLQLRMVPTSRVSGVVTAPGGPRGSVQVRLQSVSADDGGELGLDAAMTMTRGDGTFTFLGVPPGQFVVLVALRPRPPIPPALAANPMVQFALGGAPGSPDALYGHALVTVEGRDVGDIAVALSVGASVSGQLEFDGTSPAPTAQQLPAINISLQPTDPRIPPAFPGSGSHGVDSSGAFKTIPYPPGKYLISASAPGSAWMIRSVTAGGRDVFREPLELKDADVTGVAITFTDRIGQFNGGVHTTSGALPQPGATVFLFPIDYPARMAANDVRLFRSAAVSKAGTYSIGYLPAGEYYLAALDAADVPDTRDQPFFTALARAGLHLTLAEGEKRSQDLQPVRIAR